MLRKYYLISAIASLLLITTSCNMQSTKNDQNEKDPATMEIERKLNNYISFKLTTDLSILSENENLLQKYFYYSSMGSSASIYSASSKNGAL